MHAMLVACRRIALMALASFALLVIAELVARAAEPGPFRWYDISPYEKVTNLPHVHRRNARVQWDGSSYEVDSHGWRGPEFKPDYGADELRIVAIGDSCTFGKGVEETETWPRQLERVLQARLGPSRRVRVANLGVNGYSSRDYLEVLETQALALKPEVVIVGYCLNDFPNELKQVDAAVYQGKNTLRAQLSWDLREQLGKLALFRWLRATYYEVNRERDLEQVERLAEKLTGDSTGAAATLEREGERLDAMKALCGSVDAKLITMLFPYESQVYLERPVEGPGRRLHALMQERSVRFVGLLEEFRASAAASEPPARLFVRGDRYHPNAAGYGIVAQALVGHVLGSVGVIEAR
jgi:lysophospholipase L1-like esterase